MNIRRIFQSIRYARRVRDARRARLAAYRAVQDAADRDDDRDLGRARMKLEQATMDCLRAELAR